MCCRMQFKAAISFSKRISYQLFIISFKSIENQQDDASDTGDLLDDADENTETDRDEEELQQLS